MSRTDLFIRLAKYRPIAAKESFENFFTELIAHLLEEETAIRCDFASVLLDGRGPSPNAFSAVRTQVLTRSRRPALSGLFLDLVLEAPTGARLIVENKVGQPLHPAQLENYLAYAQEIGDASVAIVTKEPNQAVKQYQHDLFLGEFLWSDFAQRWAKSHEVNNRDLVNSVIELMRSRDMGPLDPFLREEIDAHSRYLSFDRKLTRLLAEFARCIDQDPIIGIEGVKRQPIDAGGYKGIGWCAPQGSPASRCPFWYFVGFQLGRNPWFFKPLQPGVTDCTTFIGIWPSRLTAQDVRGTLVPICEPLVAGGFDLALSENVRGIFVVRRRSLTDFLSEGDQPGVILEFLRDSHRAVVDSGKLGSIYKLYLQAGPSEPQEDGKDNAPVT